jgi:signal peptidase II
MRPRVLRLLLAFAVAGALLALDLGSKDWAESELRRQGSRSLFDGRLILRYQTNSGIAFGLFQAPLYPRKRVLLIAYSAAVTGALLGLLAARQLRAARGRGDGLVTAGMVAMLAGSAGNLRDRVTRGGVIDFLDLEIGAGVRWPAFNLADVYLAVGLALCLAGLVSKLRQAAPANIR